MALTILEGSTFCICDELGDVAEPTAGFFADDTRYLGLRSDPRRQLLVTERDLETPSWAGRDLRLTDGPRLRQTMGRAATRRAREREGAVSEETLRVAILSPPWFAVPPSGYGGIEWVVALLADGLVNAGHDVTLFASGD